MKVWRALIYWGLAVVAGNVGAQDANAVNQLNRLRNLQNLILQDFAEMPGSGTLDDWRAFSLGSGMTYTTNANLTPGGTTGDFYATNTTGVRWQPDLGRGFTFSSGLAVTDFRYMRNPGLSMSFLDWDLGVTWNGTWSGLDTQGYVSQTLEWTQQQAFQTQTLSSILALGGSVSREILPGHELSAASELSATPYAWPSGNAYGCVSLSASYDWTAAPGVTLEISAIGYETMYFAGERDFTASCSATVTWAIASWLSASVFASPAWNFSSTKGSGYTVVDTGVNVSGGWRF